MAAVLDLFCYGLTFLFTWMLTERLRPPPPRPSLSLETNILRCHKTSSNPINCNLVKVASHWDWCCWKVTALSLRPVAHFPKPSAIKSLFSSQSEVKSVFQVTLFCIKCDGFHFVYTYSTSYWQTCVPCYSQVLLRQFNREYPHKASQTLQKVRWVFKVTDSQWLYFV